MLNLRRGVVGVVAVLLVGGLALAQTPTDDIAALRVKANAGDAASQVILGTKYSDGEDVPQDYVEAVSWYRLAADQGYARAQYILGLSYAAGQGVPQDYVEAHKWANLAASRATFVDRKIYTEERDFRAKLMTSAELAEAQRRASEWQAAFDARQE